MLDRTSRKITQKTKKQLFYKVKNLQEAIIIEAIGVYSLQQYMDPTKLNFVRYSQPLEESVGFSGYLSDSLKMRTYIPPVSLSEHILNFGRLLPVEAYNRMCTANNCLTLVTCLTNHTDNQIEVVWQKGK